MPCAFLSLVPKSLTKFNLYLAFAETFLVVHGQVLLINRFSDFPSFEQIKIKNKN